MVIGVDPATVIFVPAAMAGNTCCTPLTKPAAIKSAPAAPPPAVNDRFVALKGAFTPADNCRSVVVATCAPVLSKMVMAVSAVPLKVMVWVAGAMKVWEPVTKFGISG